MEETKFDLSTLDLSEGTHEITVKARAEGYADSDESNMVHFTVLVQGGGGGEYPEPEPEPDEPDNPEPDNPEPDNPEPDVPDVPEPEPEPDTYDMKLQTYISYEGVYAKATLDGGVEISIDEDGNCSLTYQDYIPPFRIDISNVRDVLDVVGGILQGNEINLKNGQEVTLYPFCTDEGAVDATNPSEKFVIIGPEDRTVVVHYNGTQTLSLMPANYPQYVMIFELVEDPENPGNYYGKITMKDEYKDGSFSSTSSTAYAENVDFSQGVTIEVL